MIATSAAHLLTSNPLFVAEEARAVHDAETYLSRFSEWWAFLPAELQPSALRNAVWSLTILQLSFPPQAEIRLDTVSAAAGIPKTELREQVKRRAEICTNYRALWKRNRAAVEEEALRWML
jgi:hypothetical protein